MFGYCSQTGDLVDIGDSECLCAGEVIDIPDLHYSFIVAGDDAGVNVRTVNTDKWGLVAFEFDRRLLSVGVPDNHLEIEATTHQYFLLLGIG